MANISSKQKGGAYPILPQFEKYMPRLFKPFDNSKGRRALVLDPFANEASMLLKFARELNMDPYGVELQDEFIVKARENIKRFYEERKHGDLSLTRMLQDDSRNVEMSNGGFSIVYVNAPYDDLIISNPDTHEVSTWGRERFELTALKHFFKYVAQNGFMVWVAYSQHMTKKVYQAFRANCDLIHVYRFPEEHLDRYTQICVVGQYLKGHRKSIDPVRELENETAFIKMGLQPETIPSFEDVWKLLESKSNEAGKTLYRYNTIPALNVYRGAVHFQPRKVDEVAKLQLHTKFGAASTRAFAALSKPSKARQLEQPLHRPNRRQMAVNIASGMLDNILIERNGKMALLRGTVREAQVLVDKEEEVITNKDESFRRVRETSMIRPEHHIMLLYADGSVEDISGADSLGEIIQDNSDLLVSNFSERYRPFYTNYIHPVWNKLMDEIHPGGMPQSRLFKPQRYVIACTIEHLALKRKQITNAQQGFGKSVIAAVSMIGLRILECALWYKPGDEVPPVAEQFGITGAELIDLVRSICQRYGVAPKDILGLPVEHPVIIAVPPIAPSVWLDQELTPAYSGFKPVLIRDATEVDEFMSRALANDNQKIIHVGVVSYQNAKNNEGREPTAVPRYRRGKADERDRDGAPVRVITVMKEPSDPITGGLVTDAKGEIVPWKRFTKEGRGKTLDFYHGKVFWGYEGEIQTDDQGNKSFVLNRDRKRYTFVVPRPLSKDEIEENRRVGYPKIATRQYPLFSEIRTIGLPKLGNGHTDTPMIEKHYPEKKIMQLRCRDRYGNRTPYRMEEVTVKAYTIQVPDFANQKNLIPNEPILDPWLAWKGTRYIEYSGRRDNLDRLMKKYRLTHYRVGNGKFDLDKLLTERGLQQYTLGVGEARMKSPRFPVSEYFRRFYSGQIGMFVADELHQAKSTTTDIGAALRNFIRAASMVNGLTGTLYGGKSSSVFALAFYFDETVREDYPWTRGAPMSWIEDMGVRKMVETRDVGGGNASLRSGRKSAIRVTEAAGASPMLMRSLAKYTLWASLLDLRGRMPDKQEIPYEVQHGDDQSAIYEQVSRVLTQYNSKLIVMGDRSFLSSMYTNMLFMSDANFRPWTVYHNVTTDKGAARKKHAGVVPLEVCRIPSLGDGLQPKEIEVIEWIKKDLADGRRVVIGMIQTESRDIRDRWHQIISENVPGAKPFILKNSVASADRNQYIKNRAADGFNVMITNPGLIATAISIINFSAWYSIEYDASLYTFSQACARINRPNQERKDIVYRHFYYVDNKYQAAAIANIADKTKAAAVLSGSEGGDLAQMMSPDERVQSYSALIDAIETGKQKILSGDEIRAAFAASAFSEVNWSDSAWFMEGDEEESGTFYAENEIVEVGESEEDEQENQIEFEDFL